MCSFRVVQVHPRIKVCLHLFNRSVDFLSECDSIELVLHGSVESLANAVCLRAFRLDFRMVYILHGQIQFILVVLPVSAVLRPSVCEHTHQLQVMLLEERHYPVIEHIGSDKRILPVIELCKSYFGVSVNDCLLVNVSTPFDISHII